MSPLLYLLACAGSAPTSSPSQPALAPPLTLLVEYGSEKKSWMEEMVKRFEAGNPTLSTGEVVDVQTVAAGSGEAVLDILSGAQKPHVFSPASGAYIGLLNEQWQRQPGHTAPLCPPGEALVLSPVVIAMWKPMAEALGWPAKPIGWADLLKISADGGKFDGGRAQHGGPCLEQHAAAHRRANALGGQFLDVHPVGRKNARYAAQNAGAVVTHQLDRRERADGGRRTHAALGMHDNPQPVHFEGTQRVHQFITPRLRHLDAQNAGELPAQPAHPAFQPVAAVVSDTRRHHLHQTGPV
jgi:hypothetical protein